MPKKIAELSDLLSEMPGIGPRAARRIVQFLLRADQRYVRELTGNIDTLSQHVSQCSLCSRFDEVNQDKLCALCADNARDTSLLMVVEKDVDVESIEQSGIYRGRYFVLSALMPLARQRKKSVAPRADRLLQRLGSEEGIEEVVLAFSTTPEGDYTARELKTAIIGIAGSRTRPLAVTLLGRGLSLGAEIEYADQETLRNAFQGRH